MAYLVSEFKPNSVSRKFDKDNLCEHIELQKEIETPALLAHAIEDSTDIFGISWGEGGVEPPNHPLDTPLTHNDNFRILFYICGVFNDAESNSVFKGTA